MMSWTFGLIVYNDSRAVLLWTNYTRIPFTETPPLDFILKTKTVSALGGVSLVPVHGKIYIY